MRELLLLRHAKSSWDDATLDDADRPLAARGRKAAPVMARAIARRGWIPDLALVSPALRTRQTWALVAAGLPRSVETRFESDIYEADPQAILAAIRTVPPATGRLLVVGHNPGLERLAENLAGPGSDADALARLRTKFPTGALARFEVTRHWSGLAPGTTRLAAFLKPKDEE
ncbi:histidine phosphatase family protein [Nitratireductor sp. CAU 1489]|uniref:Histidine phosphatase family protein n=1 Tax=Nitratireductor arenosus TaxID=2682096 RepID=A0A844QFZ2_9HYPH|nr:histidine phosphatase family protein [Nitratireductor arenosus]MVA96988.1 histidine phosphatase family protein [Nitratireductor arenosus]